MTHGDARPSAGGALRWGLKHRFLQYVADVPDGQCSVTDGVSLAPGPVFVFATDERAAPGDGPGRHLLRFRGDLRFKAHFGFLRVRIANPWLEISGATGTLSAVGLGAALAPRLPLVTFRAEPLEECSVGRGTDVRLTSEGTELFGDVYPAGEPFEDFEFTSGLHPSSSG